VQSSVEAGRQASPDRNPTPPRLTEQNEMLNRALLEAAQADDLQGVQLALSRGAHVDAMDEHGWAALHYSAANGNVEVCYALMQRNCDLNATLPDYSTALMLTAEEGHMQIARLFLECGAKVKCRDENGFTVQERCEIRCRPELARLLQSLPASARSRSEPLLQAGDLAAGPAAEASRDKRPPNAKDGKIYIPALSLLPEAQAAACPVQAGSAWK